MPELFGGDIIYTMTGDMTGLENSMSSVKGQANTLGQTFTQNSTKIGLGMTAAGAAISGAFAVATTTATDFGREMAQVNTLGVEDLGLLKDGVLDLAAAYGGDVNETAKALYQTISATGLDAAEALNVLELAQKAAAAGGAEVATSVELGTGVMNAFGLTTKDLGRIYDESFIAVKNGVTTLGELGAAVGKVAPAMNAAGLSTREMFAAVGAMTKGGIATSEAVTSLNGVLSAFARQGDNSKLSSLGLEGALKEVAERFKGDQQGLLKYLGSTEALKAMLSLTGAQAKDFSQNLNEMSTATGATDAAFQKFKDANPGFAFDQLKATMAALAVEIGDKLLAGIKMVEWTRDLIEAYPTLSMLTIKFGAAMGSAMLVGGPFILALPTIVTSVKILSGAAGFAGAATGVKTFGAAAGTANAAGLLPMLGSLIGPLGLVAAVGFLAFNLKLVYDKLLDYKDATDAAKKSTEWQNDSLEIMRENLEKQGVTIDDNTWSLLNNEEKGRLLIESKKELIQTNEALTISIANLDQFIERENETLADNTSWFDTAANAAWSYFKAVSGFGAIDGISEILTAGAFEAPSGSELLGSALSMSGPGATPLAEPSGGGTTVFVTIGSIGADAADTTAIADIISEQIQTQLTAIGV
jgi:TP901 family phage tail tape measure protein